MKISEAYSLAFDEASKEKLDESLLDFLSDKEMKTKVYEFMVFTASKMDMSVADESDFERVSPIYDCAVFWLDMGIRVGKILRDAELAAK